MPLRDATQDVRVVARDIDHPECVAWHAGRLYCGTESGQLLVVDPGSGAVEVVAETGGLLNGFAFAADGSCFACDVRNRRVALIELGGAVETFADGAGGRRVRHPNFIVFDAEGALWLSDSGSGWDADDGALIRLDRSGSAEIVDDACGRFPNGLAVAPDGLALLVVESRWPGVSRCALDRGSLGDREEWLSMPGTVPDGLAFDADGSLYVACWRPDRIEVVDPGGLRAMLVDDPTVEWLTTPTNVCFGGSEMKTLYRAGLGGRELRAIDLGVAGQPLHEGRANEDEL